MGRGFGGMGAGRGQAGGGGGGAAGGLGAGGKRVSPKVADDKSAMVPLEKVGSTCEYGLYAFCLFLVEVNACLPLDGGCETF